MTIDYYAHDQCGPDFEPKGDRCGDTGWYHVDDYDRKRYGLCCSAYCNALPTCTAARKGKSADQLLTEAGKPNMLKGRELRIRTGDQDKEADDGEGKG